MATWKIMQTVRKMDGEQPVSDENGLPVFIEIDVGGNDGRFIGSFAAVNLHVEKLNDGPDSYSATLISGDPESDE